MNFCRDTMPNLVKSGTRLELEVLSGSKSHGIQQSGRLSSGISGISCLVFSVFCLYWLPSKIGLAIWCGYGDLMVSPISNKVWLLKIILPNLERSLFQWVAVTYHSPPPPQLFPSLICAPAPTFPNGHKQFRLRQYFTCACYLGCPSTNLALNCVVWLILILLQRNFSTWLCSKIKNLPVASFSDYTHQCWQGQLL